MLPFWTSFLVRTYAWIFLLRDTGLINTALQAARPHPRPLPLLYNDGAVLLGLVYGYLPFMVLPIYATLERLDPSLVEAAADLGARPLTTVFRVIVPLAKPGIIAGSVLVFIPCLGAYLTPDLLGGGRTVLVGNLVQNQFTTARDWPFGSAVSIALMALVTLLLWVFLRARKRAAGMKRWLGRLRGRVLRVPAPAAADARGLQLQLVALHRLGALLARVVPRHVPRPADRRRHVEQRHHRVLGDRHLHRDRHALRLRPLEARLAHADRRAVSFAGHARDRHRHRAARAVPVGLPLAALAARMYTVVLAHVAFSIAYVVIVVSARLRTVSRDLEEAAMDLGATEWQAFWYVTLPALAPGIVAAALLALTVSFDDYVITSMVAGVDSETLPMVIYAMARRGASPVINAISALITVVFGVLILISERVRET